MAADSEDSASPGRSPHWTRIAILALLYIATGKLGLLLAVPPGYATVIWPPSGIAIGALIMHGRGLWPGILIGSFALNVLQSEILSADDGLWQINRLFVPAGIAAGSTVQALAAWFFVSRVMTLPIDIRRLADVVLLFVLSGPLSCMVAATTGVGTLYLSGALTAQELAGNWWTWWGGDVLGVLVFLPLTLIAPWSPHRLRWQGAKIGALPVASHLVLLLPLGLTFYAWKATSEYLFEKGRVAFESLAGENERVLLHRLASYEQAILGGLGFFHGSDRVTPSEWETYVEAIGLVDHFPGINGIGFIENVASGRLDEFLADIRAGGRDFAVHPQTTGRPFFIITLIEPLGANREALGLNIGFEDNRLEAAETSRDTGMPTITNRILLVQDETKSPGFLLLHPLYRSGMPKRTVAERRAALAGWVYAPFVGPVFMRGLTASQANTLHLRVFDGSTESDDSLIYDSAGPPDADQNGRSRFVVRKRLDIYQQPWTLVWASTPAFEHAVGSNEPKLILLGGVLATGLFGALLLVFARRAETVQRLVDIKTREIAAGQETFRTAMKYAPVGMAVSDIDGNCIAANPALCRLLGYGAQEMLHINFHEITHPDDLPATLEMIQRLVSREERVHQIEKRYFHKAGHTVWTLVHASVASDADGAPHRIIAQMEDITERQEMDRIKSQFISVVSHELRTPLTSIRGSLGLVAGAMSNDLPDKVRQLVEIAHRNSERLILLINDILDIDKIASGEMTFDLRRKDLGEVVSQAVAANQAYADRFEVAFSVSETDRDVAVTADSDRLGQVLANLLSNAAKFSPEHGRVEIEVRRAGDKGEVLVRDHGSGIPLEFRDRIFTRFAQADSSTTRAKGGTGLGLHISKQIMLRMNGEIGFETDADVGATFWIRLPLVGQSAGATGAADPQLEEEKRLAS